MTGFGNNAFIALKNNARVDLVGVFTPLRQKGPFPYYPCEPLHEVVTRCDVSVYEGLSLRDQETQSLIRSLSPDLIVVATFNQIIPHSIISLPCRGVINIHPSLLPKYRGSIPTVCALLQGEERTGVTAHFIEDESIDRGRIIAQAAVNIDPADNDGILRRKLSDTLPAVLTEAIDRVQSQELLSFPEQQESEATYCLKRSVICSDIDVNQPFSMIVNKIRSLTPYPGAYIISGSVRYPVNGVTLVETPERDLNRQSYSDVLVINTSQGIMKFSIQKAS